MKIMVGYSVFCHFISFLRSKKIYQIIPKKKIYQIHFERDLKSISRHSSRGKIFSRLFQYASSYFENKYKSLDLIETVLDSATREARSAYFRF